MSAGASLRELLIAVNAAPRLSRATICRLACPAPQDEGIERWAREPPREPAGLAAELGVPVAELERALAAAAPREAAAVARREAERAGELGAQILTRLDPGYPQALADLPLPPPVLYVRGELPPGPALAIVGSRRADPYGLEVAELFASTLADRGAGAGLVIVSGFARGVDAAAHRGALAAPGGRTVAVLGCGLGVDYPQGHAWLGDEIAGRGALVTELPCDIPPHAKHFPVRNRIIAALAGGTLVVQATARSGSLVTARHALELGREVFAVPGRIFDERSVGPNSLIRDGAAPVQHPREILEVLVPGATLAKSIAPAATGSAGSDKGKPRAGEPPAGEPALETPAPGPAAAVLAVLPRDDDLTPEQIASRAGLPVESALAALLELELAGWVRRLPGPRYGRRS